MFLCNLIVFSHSCDQYVLLAAFRSYGLAVIGRSRGADIRLVSESCVGTPWSSTMIRKGF
jgi:hypothetical protein